MKDIRFQEAWELIEKELEEDKHKFTKEDDLLLIIIGRNHPEEFELLKEYFDNSIKDVDFKVLIKHFFSEVWARVHDGFYLAEVNIDFLGNIEIVYIDSVSWMALITGKEDKVSVNDIKLLSGKINLDEIKKQYPLGEI